MTSFLEKLNYLRFSSKEKQDFLEDLSSMLNDGIAPKAALEIQLQISKDIQLVLVKKMLDSLAAGRELADGMEGFFPHHIVETIRAGESSGTLGRTLEITTEHMRSQNSVLGSFISAILYPVVVIIAACAVTVFLKHSVLSQFAQIEPVAFWPENGRIVMAAATFLQNWWWAVVVILIAALIGISYFLRTNTSGFRRMLDHWPLFSIYRKMVAAQFMESLGILIANGIVFKQGLKLLAVNANPYLSWHLLLMDHRLSRGTFNVAEVLETGLLEQKDVLRLEALANVKGFEVALERQGRESAKNAVRTLGLLGKGLGGLFLGIGAGMAAYLIMALYAVGSSLHTVV